MKKTSIMIAIIIINFVFQTSLYHFVSIFGVVPNISLVLVVIFAMLTNNIVGGVLGLLTGILYDSFMYSVFGINTLIYFVIGALLGSVSEDINRENYAIYSSATFASSIFMQLATYIILFFLRYNMQNAGYILKNVIIEIVLNTVLSFIVLKFIIYFFNLFGIKLINR